MTGKIDIISGMLDLQAENCPHVSTDQAGTVIALQRLSRMVDRAAQMALSPLDITLTEFELLSALRAQPVPRRMTPSALYDAMLISSGGLTKVLGKLEARGFVDRPASDTDGRSRPVRLTSAGEAMAERTMTDVQRIERPMMDAMAAVMGSKTTMRETLVALVVAAENAGLAAPDD